ncbi:MAG: hypothetical protein LBK47_06035 [Prevotellaceae bacterium]|jgi:hypothetical protein|nr:hypothetical protein [Prevotellaceae bacterium]
MKSNIIIIVFSALLFGLTSCGGRGSNHKGIHTHEDSSVHGDHATGQVAPKQENFKVEADTTAVKANSVKHDHSHNH